MAEIASYTSPLGLALLEERLRKGFVARFGIDVGLEATAEAMAWAWANQTTVEEAANPIGLLFRVGQSKSRRYLRWRRRSYRFPPEQSHSPSLWTEPALPDALAELTAEQRTAVVLVHCFQWTYLEVAELMDVPLHTVRNRIHRGMQQLRTSLGVELP